MQIGANFLTIIISFSVQRPSTFRPENGYFVKTQPTAANSLKMPKLCISLKINRAYYNRKGIALRAYPNNRVVSFFKEHRVATSSSPACAASSRAPGRQ